jgi:ankyrin repeat protein
MSYIDYIDDDTDVTEFFFSSISDRSYDEIEQRILDDPRILNKKDCIGNSPLIYAIQSENVRFVKLFLLYGSNVNAKNQLGSSGLHFACINNNVEIVKILLQYGADWNAKSISGKTPLEYSYYWRNNEVREFLMMYRNMRVYISKMNMVLLSCKKNCLFSRIFWELPWQIEQFFHYELTSSEITDVINYRNTRIIG